MLNFTVELKDSKALVILPEPKKETHFWLCDIGDADFSRFKNFGAD